MGSYDSIEIYKFVGVYILSHLETISKYKIGLHCDDGLLLLRGANSQKLIKQERIL